ncbi:hypothetical protein [Mycolicibacter virginiensis]|uniref:hypothetical protein n=1 Tax=Mycolicibacter virginiensis TaxID=1795032 RepID=UPI001F045132|nr:hypothetical protein [Mycolicibacter virginiensis]ULP45934.1 hypothetical protein MJO54_13765 [Mycolicibacter virginiensis]
MTTTATITSEAGFESLSDGSATLPAMTNTQIADTDPIQTPAGAIRVDGWDMGSRGFYGATSVTIAASGWLNNDVCIYTGGVQHDDGTCTEWVIMAGEVHPDMPLNAAQARQIGEALIAAADELDAIAEAAK